MSMQISIQNSMSRGYAAELTETGKNISAKKPLRHKCVNKQNENYSMVALTRILTNNA